MNGYDFNNSAIFSQGKDTIALITGPLSAIDIGEVRTILDWVRPGHSENAAEFFLKVKTPKFSSEGKRKKLQAIRNTLRKANGNQDVSDEKVFQFLQHFHLLGYDFDNEASVHLSLLHSLIASYSTDVHGVFSKLKDWVQTLNKDAGTITRDNIPDEVASVFNQRIVPVEVYVYRSPEYEAMLSQRDDLLKRQGKLQERISRYPEDDEFQQELGEVQRDLSQLYQQTKDFKHNVLKLAGDFQRIPTNTKRLKLAKQYFETGDYKAARIVLDTEDMVHEQSQLLEREHELKNQIDELKIRLADNASEFLIKAHLTSTNYALGKERIAETCKYFEYAIKSNATIENLFEYAQFLQKNNRFDRSESIYIQILKYCEHLGDASERHLHYVATLLNELCYILRIDSNRRYIAEELYYQAIAIRRKLVLINPNIYSVYLAGTLNNLGACLTEDRNKHKQAETCFTEAINIIQTKGKEESLSVIRVNEEYLIGMASVLDNYGIFLDIYIDRCDESLDCLTKALEAHRKLIILDKAKYLSGLAMTLSNLGGHLLRYPDRQNIAERYLFESLDHLRQLSEDNPDAHLDKLSYVLVNLGAATMDDPERYQESERYFSEALEHYRELGRFYPDIYKKNIADVLYNLGILVDKGSYRTKEAEDFYIESLSVTRELVKYESAVYLPRLAEVLNNLGNVLNRSRNPIAEKYYVEAVNIRRELVGNKQSAFLLGLVHSLENLYSVVFNDNSRREYVKNILTEILMNRRKLAAENEVAYQGDLVITLARLGAMLSSWGEFVDARPYLVEASDMLEPLVDRYPEQYKLLQNHILQLL